MKFDVIVGNPPYQIEARARPATKPVYQLFVREGRSSYGPAVCGDDHTVALVHRRAGSRRFRARMLDDRRLSRIVDNPKLFDCFPGVEIKGGVSTSSGIGDHDGDCDSDPHRRGHSRR